MPRLRVVAGPSIDALVPISTNSDVPHTIVSDAFEGQILTYVKDFTDEHGNVLDSEYFGREDRKGITWSVQVQGRFLRPISADDVLFGNTFDRPLKLPWGSGAALKFMHFVDPTLEHDLSSSTKPWALSPLVSTMPHFVHTRLPHWQEQQHVIDREGWPPFPPPRSLSDDTKQLHQTLRSSPPHSHSHSHSPSPSPTPSLLFHSRNASSSGVASPDPDGLVPLPPASGTAVGGSTEPEQGNSKNSKRNSHLSPGALASLLSASNEDKGERKRAEKLVKRLQALQDLRTAGRRRAYFRDASHRRELIFGPEDLLTTDFCYGFMQFTPTLSLQLPGGISFDLMHYWDGQPVRFMCCERKREGESGAEDSDTPWGRVLWCVAIELVQDEDEEQS